MSSPDTGLLFGLSLSALREMPWVCSKRWRKVVLEFVHENGHMEAERGHGSNALSPVPAFVQRCHLFKPRVPVACIMILYTAETPPNAAAVLPSPRYSPPSLPPLRREHGLKDAEEGAESRQEQKQAEAEVDAVERRRSGLLRDAEARERRLKEAASSIAEVERQIADVRAEAATDLHAQLSPEERSELARLNPLLGDLKVRFLAVALL